VGVNGKITSISVSGHTVSRFEYEITVLLKSGFDLDWYPAFGMGIQKQRLWWRTPELLRDDEALAWAIVPKISP
jgi:hypothetical protein